MGMKECYLDPSKLEELAEDRPLWRSKAKSGLQRFEEDRHLKLQERREKRHRAPNPVLHAATTLICAVCDQAFSHRLGLHSHMRNIHPPNRDTSRQDKMSSSILTDHPDDVLGTHDKYPTAYHQFQL